MVEKYWLNWANKLGIDYNEFVHCNLNWFFNEIILEFFFLLLKIKIIIKTIERCIIDDLNKCKPYTFNNIHSYKNNKKSNTQESSNFVKENLIVLLSIVTHMMFLSFIQRYEICLPVKVNSNSFNSLLAENENTSGKKMSKQDFCFRDCRRVWWTGGTSR